MNTPDQSHIAGLELASSLLKPDDSLESFTQKLGSALDLARSDAPGVKDEQQPQTEVRKQNSDNVAVISKSQAFLFCTLVAYGSVFLTARKMMSDAYDPTLMSGITDVVCVVFWGFAAMYITWDEIKQRLKRHREKACGKGV